MALKRGLLNGAARHLHVWLGLAAAALLATPPVQAQAPVPIPVPPMPPAPPPVSRHAGIAAYFVAADRFDALAAHGPPRLSDPVAAVTVRRLGDSRATFGTDRFDVDDFPDLSRLLIRGHSLLMVYVRADSTPALGQGGMTFQAELMPIAAVMIDAAGIVIGIAQASVVRQPAGTITPVARAALLEMRSGLNETMSGLLGAAGLSTVLPANEMVVVHAAARNAETVAAAMTLAQRRDLLAMVATLRAPTPADRAELDRIVAALSRTECVGLCAL